MKIDLDRIKIRDVVELYSNNQEEGAFGYGGKLNIRPPYQREFVYKDKQRDAVIETIRKGFPLNVMYWVKNEDGFELLDGQQRTISICEYVSGSFSLNCQFFHNLEQEEKDEILDYELMIYICEGGNKEKLDWFKTINIAGEKLSKQELRNAIYTGPWLSDAKKYFSKSNCPAQDIARDYLHCQPIRQEYLEKVLDWISLGKIEDYMSVNQNKPNASELWLYFNNVITWTKTAFKVYRKEIRGQELGLMYNQYKDTFLDADSIEKEISSLMLDEEVTNKKGVFWYVLDKNEKHLNLRAFSPAQKREMYEKQKGICPICGKHFSIDGMEADHIIPWSKGGKTTVENGQMLCREDNRLKSNK